MTDDEIVDELDRIINRKRKPMSKQYIMKGLDDALWHAVKVKAAEKETTVKDLIVELLREWLKEK